MPTTNIRSTQVLLAVAAYLCLGLSVSAQTADSQTTENASKSWTATTYLKSDNVNPTRIIESHIQNGKRTLDNRSIQIRGSGGHFEPYQDIEMETLQVDATTVRTITRSFGRDLNGRKALVQVRQEERQTLPEGTSNVVRITSNTDLNGRLQPVQREIVATKRIGVDLEETKTTVMLLNINGGLAPVLKTDEIRKRSANDTVESEKSTLLRDGAGNWQVSELRRATVTDNGKIRSTMERVSRRDAEGKLVEVSRLLSTESERSSGEKQSVQERYSLDVPGATPDGGLHLVERTTMTQRTSTAGEQISEKRVEQPNPGDPNSGLRLSVLINNTVRPVPTGRQATLTIRTRDANGSFEVVEVDTTNSDKVLTIQVN